MVMNGLSINGDQISYYLTNDIDTSNLVNGKPVYYYLNQKDTTLVPTNPGYVACYNCSNITLGSFSVSDNGAGILFASTNNSNITDVTVGSNWAGFYFGKAAHNNTVSYSEYMVMIIEQ